MKKLVILSLSVLTVSVLPAFATGISPVFAKVAMAERVAAPPVASSGCMTETAQISISFNSMENDVSTIKSKFDGKIAEIDKLFKEAALEKFEMQSMNYSISPQNYGGASSSYNMSGSISYTLLPSSKSIGLMEKLNKKGYQASVNVSSYLNGGTPCPTAATE